MLQKQECGSKKSQAAAPVWSLSATHRGASRILRTKSETLALLHGHKHQMGFN